MDLENYIKENEIVQVNISDSIKEHENLFFDNVEYNKYLNNFDTTLFWGVYENEDMEKIINHRGKLFIYWYDNDCNPEYQNRIDNLNKIKLLNVNEHICSNKIAQSYLERLKVKHKKLVITYNSSDDSYSSKYSQTVSVNNIESNISEEISEYESHIANEINTNEINTNEDGKLFDYKKVIIFLSGTLIGVISTVICYQVPK